MKAIELERVGSPLKIVEKPKPLPRPDGVIIQMKAAPVLSYMQGVISGTLIRPMHLPKFPA